MKKLSTCLLFAALSQSVWALEPADQQRLTGIQQNWAHIQYEVAEKQRAAAFEQLASSVPWAKPRTPKRTWKNP